jgi:spermidine dehydrogenase
MSTDHLKPSFSREERELGLNQPITRRDFLNAALVGAGAALLAEPSSGAGRAASHPWTGYGGVGDYASANGNTWEVMEAAHKVRDGAYDKPIADVTETGETYDLVVVGGGFSGLGAAFKFKQSRGAKGTCLILENHTVFGGEARRNEFIVRGHRLIGPQGSNDFGVPQTPGFGYDVYRDLGLPREFEYQEWKGTKKLEFARDNYLFQLWYDHSESFGIFYDLPGVETPRWVINPWANKLKDAPYSEKLRNDFLRWRSDKRRYYEGDDVPQWLDTMSYEQYLVKVMGLDAQVARYADPILAAALGLGSDVTSAYAAYQISMPGMQGFGRTWPGAPYLADMPPSTGHSLPGGNDGIARHFIKRLIPEAIQGGEGFAEIHNGKINFNVLDRAGGGVRVRLGATAVRVEHRAADPKAVSITYVKNGKPYRVAARAVVMTSGGWVNQKIVGGLPESYREAYRHFPRSPMLVVNVAVNNWRFLYKLGITSCRWFGGLGFSCNVRRPMIVGRYRPPLDPDEPTLVTFYIPFCYPGLSAREQGARGRGEVLSKSYREYEREVRSQMTRLFGDAGFDARRDVAGIILNRWGHAYVVPEPGFYFGSKGRPAPRDVIRQPFGRIAFAHSELNGHQSWNSAVREGYRAAEQAMGFL